MTRFETVSPTLDLWPSVKDFYEKVFLPSGFYSRLDIDLPTLEGIYLASLVGGLAGVVILRTVGSKDIEGLAVVHEIVEWHKLQTVRRCFLRGVFIRAQSAGLQRMTDAGREMDAGIVGWAKSRGHDMVIAYTRLPDEQGHGGFKHRACEALYGYKPRYTVIAKHIEGGLPHGQT